ncbi:MAG: periplasmic heavy metal sensor [Alphaproteobacteria bacterium]|nr:periplasmic heavy metal sensor [Alphaproteobacteria bacterium]
MSTNKKLLSALFISLGLNIFIGGILVGRHVNSRGISLERPRFFERSFKRNKNRENKDEIRKISREIAKNSKEDIKKLKTLKRNALKAIEREPFDKKEVEKAFTDLRAGLLNAHESMHKRIIDTAEEMPAEKRTELLKMMCKGKINMYRQYGDRMHRKNGGNMLSPSYRMEERKPHQNDFPKHMQKE